MWPVRQITDRPEADAAETSAGQSPAGRDRRWAPGSELSVHVRALKEKAPSASVTYGSLPAKEEKRCRSL